ncbi:MAG: hypothetical protein O7D94_10390 [Planctomycetota bacterium]|nr:hypothetical protein [Planctomycetota bacterium]
MSGRSRTTLSVFAAVALATPIFGTGCKDTRRHKASAGVTVDGPTAQMADDASPVEVARGLIQALEAFANARRQGLGSEEDRETHDRAQARVQSLVAGKEIHRDLRRGKLRSSSLPRDATEEAVVTVLAESWASIVGRYVGGFKMETMRLMLGGAGKPDEVVVSVQAERPKDRERLDAIKKNHVDREGAGDSIRREALEQGFNIPIGVEVQVRLRRCEDASWRAIHLNLVSIREPVATGLPLRPARTAPQPVSGS